MTGHGRTVQFKVVSTEPDPFCVVAPSTIIFTDGLPIQKKEVKTLSEEVKSLSEKAKEYSELYEVFCGIKNEEMK